MLAIVDLVVSHYGTAVCPDLDPRQGVAIDVVSFDETSAVAENINASLVAVENGVAPTSQENRFKVAPVSRLLLYVWQPAHTDLIVGSLFDVIHTPAKLLAKILFSMNWPRPFSCT